MYVCMYVCMYIILYIIYRSAQWIWRRSSCALQCVTSVSPPLGGGDVCVYVCKCVCVCRVCLFCRCV